MPKTGLVSIEDLHSWGQWYHTGTVVAASVPGTLGSEFIH